MTLKDGIKKIILKEELVPTVCEDSGLVEWSDGEVDALAQKIADALVVDEETVDNILETVFQRGYAHGVSGGMSDDGEFYAVSDAKKAIAEAKPIGVKQV